MAFPIPHGAIGKAIRVLEGEESEFTLQIDSADLAPATTITGVATINGKVTQALWVNVRPRQAVRSGASTVDKAGKFTIKERKFGKGVLIVGKGRWVIHTQPIELTGGKQEIRVDVAAGSLEARLLDRNGTPRSGRCHLRRVGPTGEPLPGVVVSMSAQKNGQIRAPLVSAGTYVLEFRFGRDTSRSAPFTITAGRATRGIDLHCKSALTVRIKATLAGQPLPGKPDDWEVGYTSERGSGTYSFDANGVVTLPDLQLSTPYQLWLHRDGAFQRHTLPTPFSISPTSKSEITLDFPR